MSSSIQFSFVFRGGDNESDDDDSATDDEMPPLEISRGANNNNTNVNPPGASTPTRRIVRAVRPKNNNQTITLANYRNQPSAGGTAANPVTPPNDANTSSTTGSSSVPLAVNWNLFPAAAAGSTTNNDNQDEETSTRNRGQTRNYNQFAALQSETSEDEELEEDDDDDEVLSYHSSEEEEEEDDDEDDDDDDDPPGPFRSPAGVLNFFRMMREMAEDDDDEDDDEDSGPCTCPHCLMERMGCTEEDSDDEEEDTSEIPLDANASPCAICMEHETAKRPFVHLPCCGVDSDGKERTSSTRFCQKCAVRYMARNGCGVPKTDASSDAGMLCGECPRCKTLLVLKDKDDSSANLFDGRPYYKRTQPVKASTQSLHWYIGRKDGGQYRVYLLTLAWCPPHYIPEELLLNDTKSAERIAHLCQWGLLTKKVKEQSSASNKSKSSFWIDWTALQKWFHTKLPEWVSDPDAPSSNSSSSSSLPNTAGWIYQMDPQVQLELRALLLQHLEIDVDDDLQLRLSPSGGVGEENGRKQSFMAACNCAASAWMALGQFRVGRATRIANRGVTLLLLASKCLLPPVSQWTTTSLKWHAACWHAMTCLNVVLLAVACRILYQAIWIGVYLGQAFLLCQLVGSILVKPKAVWKRWLRNGVVLYAITYGLYRLVWWFSDTTSGTNATTAAEVLKDEL